MIWNDTHLKQSPWFLLVEVRRQQLEKQYDLVYDPVLPHLPRLTHHFTIYPTNPTTPPLFIQCMMMIPWLALYWLKVECMLCAKKIALINCKKISMVRRTLRLSLFIVHRVEYLRNCREMLKTVAGSFRFRAGLEKKVCPSPFCSSRGRAEKMARATTFFRIFPSFFPGGELI